MALTIRFSHISIPILCFDYILECVSFSCLMELTAGFGSVIISRTYTLQSFHSITLHPTVWQIKFIDLWTMAK